MLGIEQKLFLLQSTKKKTSPRNGIIVATSSNGECSDVFASQDRFAFDAEDALEKKRSHMVPEKRRHSGNKSSTIFGAITRLRNRNAIAVAKRAKD